MIIDPYTWHQFAIEEKISAASDTVAIRFKRPAGYQFRAGQYAIVRISTAEGRQLIRQYSFTSAPDDDLLELLVQREPSGIVSNWFYSEAELGDTVELSQPFGGFTLEPVGKRPILLIAGRVGVAPFLSMLREAYRSNLTLLYSVRTEDQVCFPELLEQHRTQIIVTAHTPRIDKSLLGPLLAEKPLVYICGSKQFVDAIMGYLLESGVPEDDVRRELFTLQ
jgi:ferredoxin-NADP reductase